MKLQAYLILILIYLASCFGSSFVLGQTTANSSQAKPLLEISVTGVDNPELRPFDKLMTEFIREHSVPGASLAVSRDGVLVYARGFGLCNVEQGKAVLPSTRFRIASLSKPITAAAITSLVHDGKLNFDDKLISFMTPKEQAAVHPQIQSVTIRQLLHHRGGWDGDASFDPMFKTVSIGKELGLKGPANQSQIIKYMLQRPLDFEPGTKYAYSNFGYCLLGRIIERVSKKSYGDYVQQRVFSPLGIRSAALARSLKTADDETRYYTKTSELVPGVVPGVIGKEVPVQYGGWCIENMDSHGGWIASACDLVAFADAYNGPGNTGFLTDELISETFKSDPSDREKDVFYGFGWSVRRLRDSPKVNTWHNGALAGTSTLLVRRHDGLNWAVLFNSREGNNKKNLASLIDPLVHRAADKITQWPEKEISVE